MSNCEHRWGRDAYQFCGEPKPPGGMCRCGVPVDDHRWRKDGSVEAWLEKPICPDKAVA